MSTIRFLYKSQLIVDDEITENSPNPVSSGAVYNAVVNSYVTSLTKSGYLTDVLTNIERTFVTSYDNGYLKVAEGGTVYIPNGFDEEGVAQFKPYTIPGDITVKTIDILGSSSVDDDYDFFMSINTNTNTWVGGFGKEQAISPITGEPIQMVRQSFFVQKTAPVSTTAGALWWDLTNNIIKENTGEGGWSTSASDISIPLCLVSRKNQNITGILQDFSTAGYCGYAVWVNKGLQVIMSNGRLDATRALDAAFHETDHVQIASVDETVADFEDIPYYLTENDEVIIDLEGVWSFNKATGLYEDGNDNSMVAAKIGSVSGTHLLKDEEGNPIEGDGIKLNNFYAKNVMIFATQDDIDALIALIGSATGVAFEELRDVVYNLIDKEAQDVIDLKALIASSIQAAIEDLNSRVVHNSGNETIEGIKTFSETIVGNVSGHANTVMKYMDNTNEGYLLFSRSSDGTENNSQPVYFDTNVKVKGNVLYANEFSGVATKARYADLAEVYKADDDYAPGTLVRFGGEQEITVCKHGQEPNAVVSEQPGFILNADGKGLPIALSGRVRLRVLGTVKKFDEIVMSPINGVGMVKNEVSENSRVIARALEDKTGVSEGLVMCVTQLHI